MHSVDKTRSLSLAALLTAATLGCQNEPNLVITTDLNLETTALGRVLTGDVGRTLCVFGATPTAPELAWATGPCITKKRLRSATD